ncbi:hypothetical protein E2562_000971 [Oryza meyeriana var. granulata]|uniref:Uncharacterized protein n=1 Tax=Oryza meyeriana var. granulata TaxID=110450 RepID=A0A6G1CX44_9ORYZ|nr:hypothetical protein E2562_000971 [Oryza meyeriana var. granulata]
MAPNSNSMPAKHERASRSSGSGSKDQRDSRLGQQSVANEVAAGDFANWTMVAAAMDDLKKLTLHSGTNERDSSLPD